MVYEAADGSELPLLVFEPAEGTRLAAGIVVFHGGALRTGSADGLARTVVSWRRAGSSLCLPGIG
ncbi:hypothetical protein AB0H83_37920 [Dactylosporangium sp. NPDC050688]|uniref:hypothetical protein n=1 Tax=Dactylosporangium sp. NPDC050688 TaxID=3157217 RepID=UPI0033EF7AA1